jgi:GAF domain-containing protein
VHRVNNRLAQVAGLIAAEAALEDGPAVATDLPRLCRAAARALHAVGAGVTVMTGQGARGFMAASDPSTQRLEELQFTTGEGPCVDAYAQRRPVLVPDLDDHAMTRWPGYAPAVHAAGVRGVFAFPLHIGATRLGIFDIFRTRAGTLADVDLTLALTFADVTSSMLLSRHYSADPGPGDDGLDATAGSRAELFQAQGMAMVQLDASLADAMARIRAYAYAEDRPLSDVVADIVGRRLRFDTQP